MNKLIGTALLLASLILPFASHADMLPDDAHVVTRSVQIENVSDFSSYDFYLATLFKFPGVEKVASEAPVAVYGGTVRLFAVKKEDANSVKRDESDPENADGWYDLAENAPLLLWSDLTLSLGEASLPDTNPTVNERYVIRIDGVNGGVVAAHRVRTERQNAKGEYAVEKGATPTAAVPAEPAPVVTATPAAQQPAPSPYNSVVILVLAGLLGLAVGFGVRSSWKK